LLNSTESDAEHRPSDQYWHEKQTQPWPHQTNYSPRTRVLMLLIVAPVLVLSIGPYYPAFSRFE
jgi:hypothetical protein